ncbi:hypothetical protein CEUSTIGMA_g9455.t1 [Chlamydomonas eustigma]|uniref:CCT domain-containing protein n=1 Tax=Chlamydomonas eustigma TaxID=1157962 RepID=A0A250XG24_9CHLO|nr:hypothetical protein CEUSTIGMA_g9455.t1 [Chlamydomonas eustigma]|eukprot:GAX82027.1 hypothetical protein CEUSTIGMA_g9455.t1 [Chlamydomonas eustigma]
MHSIGSGNWPNVDASGSSVCNINDPLGGNTPTDDWLAPVLNTNEILDDFISALEAFPAVDDFTAEQLSAPPSNLEELDEFFQRPTNRVSVMRTSFSMNDLQVYEAPSAWNPRLVSLKPSLASVPELEAPEGPGGQPAVNLMPMGMYAADIQQKSHEGFPYQSQNLTSTFPTYQQISINGLQPKGLFQQHSSYAESGYNGQMLTAHAPPSLTKGTGFLQSNMPLPPNSAVSLQPHGVAGALTESPEHHMTDAIKAEPGGWDTDSSGGGQAGWGGGEPSGTAADPHRLQPSGGAALRKSQSALELGAWKKIAAGDMDFLDPSGSVREQLQGLDYVQQVGKLTPEERLLKILRYRAKRQMRNFNRTIKYQCRKSLADTRPRVRGRFARDNEPGSVLPHETKKALREKSGKAVEDTGAPGAAFEQQSKSDNSYSPELKMESDEMTPTGPLEAAGGQAAPLVTVNFHPNHLVSANASTEATSRQAGLLEQHASLAQLYNQWSEVGVAGGGLKESELKDASLRGQPCNSNSA